MNGIVSDIQRCSFDDGPGIRAVVFLKGCPLRCAWCHNPESLAAKTQIMYDAGKCVRCGKCAYVCPRGAHKLADGKHIFRRELCDNCGLCAVNCPYGPLSTVGREMGADEVAAEVTRDRAYYEHSGGGATLSGGEPLMQFAFSAELLKKLKEQGIHTCVETCGFAGRDKLAALLPLVDIFLFDYKATDPEAHRTLTGVSNELILDNLEFLVNSGAKVILRCPLIPGVNDSAEHLAAIAELSGKYPDLLGVEVMPYHNMGVGKAKRAGVDMPELEIGMPGEEIKGQWREKLEKYGCVKLKIN